MGIQSTPDPPLCQAVASFFERPDIHGNLALLGERLPAGAAVYAAGGALRNLLIATMHGSAPPTRDIDLFIGGLEGNFVLADVLADQPAVPTDLKGMRWHPAGSDLVYDLSLLPDFLVIDAYGLDPTPENLLASIDFTINAILYDVRHGTLVERGCSAAVRSRVIDFNSRRIPDKGLMAYRILLMAHKTGFRLAEPVFDFVRHRLELETVRGLKGLLRAKVGKGTAAEIMALYDALCRHHSYGDYRRAHGTGPGGE